MKHKRLVNTRRKKKSILRDKFLTLLEEFTDGIIGPEHLKGQLIYYADIYIEALGNLIVKR